MTDEPPSEDRLVSAFALPLPSDLPPRIREIEEQLTGPGGPFEVAEEIVFGEPMVVMKNRPRSLRQLLQNSLSHGDAERRTGGPRGNGPPDRVRSPHVSMST